MLSSDKDQPDSDDNLAPPRPPRGKLAGRVLVAALAVAVFAGTAFGFTTRARLDAALRTVAALDPDSAAILDPTGQVGDENVLVLGLDPDGPVGGPRADTVLLAHLPAGGGAVTALSFPPDLEVSRPACERWDPLSGAYLDQTEPAQTQASLRSAFDVGGPRCATRLLQQLTGLEVTRFVGLDLSGVGDVVDAVGGVQLCVARPVLDGALGQVIPVAGPVALDGRRARDFLRARDVDGEPATGPHARQHLLLAALLDAVLGPDVLFDPGRVGALAPALRDTFLVDGADLDRLLAISGILRSLGGEGVGFAEVPTETGAGGTAVLDDQAAAELLDAVRDGDRLPGPAGSGPSAVDDVAVAVLNGSGRAGLAGEVGETLAALGFRIGEVGTAPDPVAPTVIRASPDTAAVAELLAETVPSATIEQEPGTTGVLQLVLGSAFDGELRPPALDPTSDTAAAPAPLGCD